MTAPAITDSRYGPELDAVREALALRGIVPRELHYVGNTKVKRSRVCVTVAIEQEDSALAAIGMLTGRRTVNKVCRRTNGGPSVECSRIRYNIEAKPAELRNAERES